MNEDTLKKIREKNRSLTEAYIAFDAGSIAASELKKLAAPLGIYEQRDGLFMMRIRVSGGELSLGQAEKIIAITGRHGISSLHITTRQDLQLHDVPVSLVPALAEEFLEAGMPFLGGGGDTFRNVTACPQGGFSDSSVFDTVPYAVALSDYLMDFKKAFALPRKFKIAFSCSGDDFSMAKFNDLGFIAKFADDGRKGFEVYSGGGMGRESSPGIRIFEFAAAKDILRIAVGAISFFYDHGNREDRSRARFRFVLSGKGEVFFREHFLEYLDAASGVEDFTLSFPDRHMHSLIPRLFIPLGNLSTGEFAKIAGAARESRAEFLRLSQEQDIHAGPFAPDAATEFLRGLPEYSGENISGLVKSCVGSKVCKIGLLDARASASAASLELDRIIAEFPGHDRAALVRKLSEMFKISGCHNSCGLNRAAKYGFQGMRKNIGGAMRDFYKFQKDASRQDGIMSGNTGIEIPADGLPGYIAKLAMREIEAEESR